MQWKRWLLLWHESIAVWSWGFPPSPAAVKRLPPIPCFLRFSFLLPCEPWSGACWQQWAQQRAAALSNPGHSSFSKTAQAWWNGGADLLESRVHHLTFCLHLSALLGNEETPHFTEVQQTASKRVEEKPGLGCTNWTGLEPTRGDLARRATQVAELPGLLQAAEQFLGPTFVNTNPMPNNTLQCHFIIFAATSLAQSSLEM